MVKRMKEIAENEQEAKNLNSELQQLEEIQEKLEAKLLGADKEQVCAEDTHPHTRVQSTAHNNNNNNSHNCSHSPPFHYLSYCVRRQRRRRRSGRRQRRRRRSRGES